MSRLYGPPRLRFAPCTCGPSSVVRRVEYGGGSVLQVIDVDAEPELRSKYGFEVPVVEIIGGPTFSMMVEGGEFSSALRRMGEEVEA